MCGVKQVAETVVSGIDSLGILFDHPVAVVPGRERLNGAFHHGDPLARQSGFIAVVIEWHHFQLQRAIQRLGVQRIDFSDVGSIVPAANRKAIYAVVSLSTSHRVSRGLTHH